MINKISIQASRNYDILIGQNLLSKSGEYILDVHKLCKVMLITDTTVYDLYADGVRDSLESVGFEVSSFTIEPGEASKCLNTINDILEFLASEGFVRSDIIVSLGGGVVGDIAGFAASMYQRGIEYVQIPTTFLSAIDSSVGGKTGVNLEAGKNLAGTFWQPSLVICDCNVFKTLSYEIFLDGVAEALKYGFIKDASLFHLLASEGRGLYDKICPFVEDRDEFSELVFPLESSLQENGDLNEGMQTLIDIIEKCISIKAALVAEDEFDTGVRHLLNFGHTFAHAIEKVSNFEITHGHAVAMGMLIIARACARQGLCTEECPSAIQHALTEFGFPTDCPHSPAQLLDAALLDKKRAGLAITLIVPIEIGQCVLHKVSIDEMPNFIVE